MLERECFLQLPNDAVPVQQAGHGIIVGKEFQLLLVVAGLLFQGLADVLLLHAGQFFFRSQACAFFTYELDGQGRELAVDVQQAGNQNGSGVVSKGFGLFQSGAALNRLRREGHFAIRIQDMER
ncbi:hypothetical protein D9M68_645810 [compost metagenome]